MKNPWDVKNNREDKKPDSGEKKSGDRKLDDSEIEDFAKNLFKKLHKESGGKKLTKNRFDFNNYKIVFKFFIPILFLFWCASGIYKINSDENGVVTYFGKFHEITQPGLHFHIPYPVGDITKVTVTRINQEEFGFSTSGNTKYGLDEESLMLTGDENIADIDFELQWKVGNVRDFVFNAKDQRSIIRSATESVMREIIAARDIDDVLADKKFQIESDAKNTLQAVFDEYKIGVEVLNVQLLRADPPKEVISAFRDVQTAKADKEKKINSARAYSNDILPKARGEAEAMLQDAEAYKKSTILKAEGETDRFNKIYNEYKLNKYVTKKRIYLETMEEVFENNNKVIIDKNIGNGLIQFLKD